MAKRIPRLPSQPSLPKGMTLAEFRPAIRWGNSDATARARSREITLAEIENIGMTLQIAEEWLIFYQYEILRRPENPSARGRVDLMKAIIRKIKDRDKAGGPGK